MSVVAFEAELRRVCVFAITVLLACFEVTYVFAEGLN